MQDSLDSRKERYLEINGMGKEQIIYLLDNIFGKDTYSISENGELFYELSDIEITDKAGDEVFKNISQIKKRLEELYRLK